MVRQRTFGCFLAAIGLVLLAASGRLELSVALLPVSILVAWALTRLACGTHRRRTQFTR